MNEDRTLENLLDLDGMKMVIDEKLGLWVKFEAYTTAISIRKNGIRYSLTLHDKEGSRIMGFDNAHEIEYGAKRMVSPKRIFDHWHYDEKDEGRPYNYVNAGRLLEDFWIEVDKRLNSSEGENKMKTFHKIARVGIMSLEDFKKYSISIAKGEHKPKKNAPKIWFNSIKSLAQVLSEENRHLLKLIIEQKPKSVSELEPLTGRKANNLLRTLRMMEHYGLVALDKSPTKGKGRTPLVPKALYATIDIKLDFCAA